MQRILNWSGFVCLMGILFSQSLHAQTINAGPDITVPACQPCTTLKATTTAPSVGTNNYTVSQITYTPYPFFGGTTIPLNIDDRWSAVYTIPFDFCYFGNTYTQFIISTNGQISFNINQANTFNPWSFNGVAPLPNAAFVAAHNSIMSPYHDILPTGQNIMSYNTFGTAPNRVFVVSWNNSPMFSCTNLLATQQIALYEGTNVIETYIANKPLCANWNAGTGIHGIQNNGGTVAFIVPGRNLPTQWSATNDAWRFQPVGGGGGGGQAGVQIDWYDAANPGTPIATNVDSVVVCPTQNASYIAKATFFLCGGTDTASDIVNVYKQPPVQVTTISTVPVNCFGGNDGSFVVGANGGSGSYTYSYNGIPMNGPSQSGLQAGTYTVTATDQFNCTGTTELTITQPTEVLIGLVEKTDVLCKYQRSGTVTVNALGGVPGYQFWYGNNAPSLDTNYKYLGAGTYRFYVSDTHGCLDSLDTEIFQPDSLLVVSLEAKIATCIDRKDGRVDAYASGGTPPYAYEWNTNPVQTGTSATNLVTGVYHVVVKDANQCITATQVPVEQELCCRLFLPDAFTPNGDGNNDKYRINERGGGVIMGEFKIYNRWGQEVFSTRELEGAWDGSYRGELQDPGTFHYVVIYQCNEKGYITQKIAKGDLILIR
ncbi:MAG: gliding motility-associated C-terminal domain-containing protein [Chitinophagaceae bacterium]